MRMLWEDFVSSSGPYLTQICEFLGESSEALQGLERRGEGIFRVGSQHTLAGNPDKLKKQQTIELRQADYQLSRKDRAAVTALAFPLLVKYGYL